MGKGLERLRTKVALGNSFFSAESESSSFGLNGTAQHFAEQIRAQLSLQHSTLRPATASEEAAANKVPDRLARSLAADYFSSLRSATVRMYVGVQTSFPVASAAAAVPRDAAALPACMLAHARHVVCMHASSSRAGMPRPVGSNGTHAMQGLLRRPHWLRRPTSRGRKRTLTCTRVLCTVLNGPKRRIALRRGQPRCLRLPIR